MNPPPAASFQTRALLDHTAWVQELAHRLVRDPHLADDLAQETVLAALREPSPPQRMRAWLGTVLRNLVWERLRGDDRRAARESSTAREEAIPSTLELVERMSTHRVVVEQVMELPEHYREVLLRRYFEGETPTQIAAQLDVPVSTVKTRLARAHDLMRERLDRQHGGDGKSWLNALAPLAARAHLGEAATTTAAAGVLPWLVAAGFVAAAVLVWRFAATPERDVAERVSALPGAAPAAVLEPEVIDSLQTTTAARTETVGEPVTEADDMVASVRLEHAPNRRFAGHVFDVEGRPVQGVVLQLRPYRKSQSEKRGQGLQVAVSDDEGAFELTGIRRSGRVHAVGGRYVTVVAGEMSGEGSRDAAVVVADRHPVAGRVLDDSGRPLENVRVALDLPLGFRTRFEGALERSSDLRFETATGSDGRFELAEMPRVPGAKLRFTSDGHEEASMLQPNAANAQLDVTLVRILAEAERVEGRVIDAEGQPVADARVSTGYRIVRTDASGLFALPVDEVTPYGELPDRIIAAKVGLQPVSFVAKRDELTGEPRWPETVELRLNGPPLTVRGHVVDTQGRGLRGVRVWVTDSTVLRDPSRPHDGDSETRRVGDDDHSTIPRAEVAERFVLGDEGDPWVYDVTAPDGSFEIEGLGDREYTLAALDPGLLVGAQPVRVRAGASNARLVIDTHDVIERIEGVVVDPQGEPVSGVRVRTMTRSLSVSMGERTLSSELESSSGMVTGPDGRFWLDGFPREGAVVRVEGRHVLPLVFGITEEERGILTGESELRLVVDRLVRFHVELDESTTADAIEVRDAGGEVLPLHSLHGQNRWVKPRAPLTAGRSEALRVSERAAEIRFYRADELLRAVPVRLTAGESTVIRR